MRVIYLHQYFKTPQMSGGTRSYEMARRLVANGHDVHMITTMTEPTNKNNWYRTREAGIHVHWLPVLYSNYMRYGERLRAFLKFAIYAGIKAVEVKGDVILATSTPLTIALPALYVSKRLNIPLVFEVRDLWPEVPVALGVLRNKLVIRLAQWLEDLAYSNSCAIIALAPGMKEYIHGKGYSQNKIAIIPNGSDIELFGSPGIQQDSREILILYAGTIGQVNGVAYIVRLAAALNRLYPQKPVRFIIIGDGKLLAENIQLAKSMNIYDVNISFLGKLPKNDISAWLSKCSLTLMTYDGPEVLYRDSVSNKFFDSMAAGKPVLANFRGFSSLLAEAHGAGCILPHDNINEAAHLVAKIIEDRQFMSQAAVEARKIAHVFDRNKLAEQLEKLLSRVVAGDNNVGDIGSEFSVILKNS